MSSDQAIRNKILSALSGSGSVGDSLHEIFTDFGYPQTLTFSNLWNMYRRLGIAKSAVEMPVDSTWSDKPVITSDDQAFIQSLDSIPYLWERLKGLDMRQRVGRYAGLFMRVADGRTTDKPIQGKLNGPASLIGMTPVYEGQLRVSNINNDPASRDFGLPTMYEFYSSGTGNRDEKSASAFSIHPSRIIIAAEDSDNGSIYGIPALEACFNSLMDIRKVIGAGAEGFYRNAAQSLILELSENATANADPKKLEALNEAIDDFMRNRARRSLWVPGMKASTINSNLISPKDHFDNALNDIAAAVKIPATILVGQQTGRLASDQDIKTYLSTIQSRRLNFANEIVRNTLDWLSRYGILPDSSYEIEWSDVHQKTDEQRLTNAKSMSEINQIQFSSGGSLVFTEDEIRQQAGYETLEEITLDDEGEDQEPDNGIENEI